MNKSIFNAVRTSSYVSKETAVFNILKAAVKRGKNPRDVKKDEILEIARKQYPVVNLKDQDVYNNKSYFVREFENGNIKLDVDEAPMTQQVKPVESPKASNVLAASFGADAVKFLEKWTIKGISADEAAEMFASLAKDFNDTL